MTFDPHSEFRERARRLQALAAAGYRPVIDRAYPLDEVVEATRYVETRQKTGNVVFDLGIATRVGL